MAHWLLQSNPDKWRIFDFLSDGNALQHWTVRRHLEQVTAGDDVLLWLAGPSGGAVGIGHATGPVSDSTPQEVDDGYWAPGELVGTQHLMPIQMEEYFFDSPIPRMVLRQDPDFAAASIFRAPRSANPFPLTDGEWSAVLGHLERESDSSGAWDLIPGERIRRVDLHSRYGGSGQSGISPCVGTPNVMVFSDPRSGERLGYIDEWAADDTFLYAGEGQVGDQTMTGGNKAILNHINDGRALRLFEGARGTVQYAGEFQIDPDEPWHYIQARQRDSSVLRQVIRFRLHRLAEPTAAAEQLTLTTGLAYRRQDEQGAIAPPTVRSSRDPDAGGRGLRTHRRLQNLLADAAAAAGLVPWSPAPHDPDFDLLWFTGEDAVTVVEVKSLTRANEIRQLRMGLGQVLDYADTLSRRHARVDPVLYLPRPPTDPRWIDLAKAHGILIRWPADHTDLLPASVP